jgi:septum formation protein
MIAPPRLVLASASQTRARILAAAGIEFAVDPASIDEAAAKREYRAKRASVEEVAGELAERKARTVAARNSGAWVIGADQMLDFAGSWFDKPRDAAGARAQLLALEGNSHRLISAVAIASGSEILWRHHEAATLTMRRFGAGFLDRYLAETGAAALQSVGSYQLEARGIQLFERIEGDYFAILGLPLLSLLKFLRERGALAG